MKLEHIIKLAAIALMTIAVERLFSGDLIKALLLALFAAFLVHLSVKLH
jgi:hypothetical protein